MKLKKVVSLFLALVMSFALAAPAFAAEPGDGDEGIMPLAAIYDDRGISVSSGNPTRSFTTTPSNGKYIRVWFLNRGSEPVIVTLRDSATHEEIGSMKVAVGGGGQTFTREIRTPDKPCTYYLYFESYGSGARVMGDVTVSQYPYNPDA